jgi:hypothetical protein
MERPFASKETGQSYVLHGVENRTFYMLMKIANLTDVKKNA